MVVWVHHQHRVVQHLIVTLIGRLCLVDRDHAEFHARQPTGEAPLASVLGHPLPLVLPAFLADTALHVGGISSVLEVDSTGSGQSGLQCLAGHVDLDELDRWMRIGWERRRGATVPYPGDED
jgi:hypothetical protein